MVTILLAASLLLITTSCYIDVGGDLYPGTWRGPFAHDGGENSETPEIITLDVWYTSTLADGAKTWYGVRVVNGSTYEVYFDDGIDGSGTYGGDVQVLVTNDSELIDYGDAVDGYTTPLTFTAEEDVVCQTYSYNSETGATDCYAPKKTGLLDKLKPYLRDCGNLNKMPGDKYDAIRDAQFIQNMGASKVFNEEGEIGGYLRENGKELSCVCNYIGGWNQLIVQGKSLDGIMPQCLDHYNQLITNWNTMPENSNDIKEPAVESDITIKFCSDHGTVIQQGEKSSVKQCQCRVFFENRDKRVGRSQDKEDREFLENSRGY